MLLTQFLDRRLKLILSTHSALQAFTGTRPDEVLFADDESENFLTFVRLADPKAGNVRAFELRLIENHLRVDGLSIEVFCEGDLLALWTHGHEGGMSELLQMTIPEFVDDEDDRNVQQLQPGVLFGVASPHEALYVLGRYYRRVQRTEKPKLNMPDLVAAIRSMALERLDFVSARSWIYRAGMMSDRFSTYEELEEMPGMDRIPDRLIELVDMSQIGVIRERPIEERLGLVTHMIERLYAHRLAGLIERNAIGVAPRTLVEREQIIKDLSLAYFLEQEVSLNQGLVEAL